MTTYNTQNPIGSTDPKDLYDNAENLDKAINTTTAETWDDRLGVERKTWYGIEQDAEQRFQEFLVEQGYQELGEYAAGIEITQLNQVVTVGDYLYRLSPSVGVPYTTSGDWNADSADFIQIDFVTASQLDQERTQRQSSDASLQQQIIDAAPLQAAETPIISWHPQVLSNSIVIPANMNARTIGPSITLADGVSVTLEDGAKWTILNGAAQ